MPDLLSRGSKRRLPLAEDAAFGRVFVGSASPASANSVVRRNFVAKISRFAGSRRLHELVELTDLCLQQIYLLLLSEKGSVQLFQVIFAETELDLEFRDSGFQMRFPFIQWRRAPVGRPSMIAALLTRQCGDQAKFFAAKSQFASEFRKVSTNLGRALR